ncbi:hypothetical protein RM780_10620 [Streptomyces sp. DSM 44917]|uniref:Transcriptional regulator n=1 Tax=Streptomyces boetiae TaxID=3075541 RepID=A0ABU2L781_9ACTN|nr:hypothetical protein [Streptomyces sp. DSM 44917]MDT0307416.1 hypothetical protein [Streptomyces sp. DSM 44917]
MAARPGSRPRTPNASLGALLEQARWSRTQLALAVNRVGAEAGLELRYDQSAVSHWVGGTMPRAHVRPLVCEALSRRLNRPVTLREAGFAGPGCPGEGVDLAEELIDIGRQDMDPSRRGMVQAGMYSAALAVPVFAELAGRSAAVAAGRTARIGTGEVTGVRTMTERIAAICDELGGGNARPMAAAFLVNTVGPYLRASAADDVRKKMLSAAADLVYLTGWMAMYEREHGVGQRYYVKALELAAAAEDHVTFCRTLRGMSLQATSLGHGTLAQDLADSAAEAADASSPRLRAFLAGQQAGATAMAGDRRRAFVRLREAERALSRAESDAAPPSAVGGYDRCAYQFHLSSVLYETGDLPGSIDALQQSIRVQPPGERQSRMHAHAVLAGRQFELGHLDAACASWQHFLDDYQYVSTARGDGHLRTMRRRLAAWTRSAPVRELLGRARQVADLKS